MSSVTLSAFDIYLCHMKTHNPPPRVYISSSSLCLLPDTRVSQIPLFRCSYYTWQDTNFEAYFFFREGCCQALDPCHCLKKKKRKSTEKGSVLRPSAGNTRRLVNTFHVTTMATAARSRSGVTRAPACRHFGTINSSELNRSRRRFNSSVVETKRQ